MNTGKTSDWPELAKMKNFSEEKPIPLVPQRMEARPCGVVVVGCLLRW